MLAEAEATQAAQLTVAIPTLNEAANLPALLQDLAIQRDIKLQVIVADGGSTDATSDLATSAGAELLQCQAGRARQMNAAAAVASAEMILFLHADSRLPSRTLLADALAALMDAQRQSSVPVAGHFALKFADHARGQSIGYRQLQAKTELNRANCTNGDQAVLVKLDHFIHAGRFDESMPFLEDQRFAEAWRQCNQWVTLPGRLTTSARRFETEGFARRYTLMSIIMGMHAANAEEFFRAAKGLYLAQHHVDDLDLAPFFPLLLLVLWRLPAASKLKLGLYISSNAWQFALLIDVARNRQLGTGVPNQLPRPALAFYDQQLAAFFSTKFVGWLTLLLACSWFFAVLWPLAKLRQLCKRFRRWFAKR